MPEAGQIVGSRYRLIRPLGEGGMASVWAAEHLTMGNIVAVKIISQDLLQYELVIARFNREARAAAKLRSPYVVQLFDHDVDPVLGPYIAMELLEGESLADRLDRDGTVPTEELCRIMLQVGKGLAKAHAAGIVHRDLKPENIFLAVDDDAEQTAKILDFGVAKADSPLIVRGGNRTAAGTLVGTLNYMSPEQAQGREVNHLSDLWSLGVIAFEALVGRRPFDDEAPGAIVLQICAQPIPVPSKLNPGVPPGFDAWFAQACNRNPAKRFASSTELATALAEACNADELSLDDMLSVATVEEPESVPSQPEVSSRAHRQSMTPPRKSKRVLQLVDSAPPPPPPGPAPPPPALPPPPELARSGEQELFEVDVEFEPEPEYFVTHGSLTVGPATMDTLRAGYQAGYLPPDALLWTSGWPAWKKALEVFALAPERARRRHAPNLALVGSPVQVPAGVPAPPIQKPSAVTAVRATTNRGRPREPVFYLHDGTISVGPVRASMLRQGLEQATVGTSVLVWRDGWDDWRMVGDAEKDLAAWKPTASAPLRNRKGIESVGLRTKLPAKAPPIPAASRTGGSSH